jgi:serine/threonine protein phosphatase 1
MAAVLTYAIGDIHGSYTKLVNLLRHCNDHCGENDAHFVLLGDYVDRGRRSREVVKFLIEAQAASDGRIVCLMGNHELMVLNAANLQNEMVWLDNGGDTTLLSYGVTRAADIPAEHLAWLEQLPCSTGDDKRFFVHAGIMPGIALDQQRPEVMLWIREPFLSDPSDHGRLVVHGHTPTGTGIPELHHNRLNLDTYAWSGHPLFAAVFDERRVGPLAFIADDGTISVAPPINAREREMFGAGMRARWR